MPLVIHGRVGSTTTAVEELTMSLILQAVAAGPSSGVRVSLDGGKDSNLAVLSFGLSERLGS